MTYLSIIEKFKILFNLFMDFKSILALMIIITILSVLYIVKKINTKKYTLTMIGSFLLVFAISIISNYKILSNTFDDFTNIFFTNIYFPSIYVYIATLVISFISFITSILNIMIKKIYKVINSIMFILNNILLIVILNIIAKNKIDIFSVSSLYTNTNLVAILELSMGLFIVWILSLVIIYATNSIYERIGFKNKKVINQTIEVSVPDLEEEYINSNEKELEHEVEEPSIILEKNPNTIVIEETNKEEELQTEEKVEPSIILEENPNTIVIDKMEEDSTEEENKITFSDILNGNIPVMYYETEMVSNDYNIINPQEIYEKNYIDNKKIQDIIEEIEPIELEELNKIKNEITEEIIPEEESNEVIISEVNIKKQIINEDENEITEEIAIEQPEIITEEINEIEEIKVVSSEEEKHAVLTSMNTISLDELEDEESIISSKSKEEKEIVIEENNEEEYTINDYKRIAKMLNNLKNQSNKTNISIDDAVTLSLISNYSIEDCIKLKEILESNVN